MKATGYRVHEREWWSDAITYKKRETRCESVMMMKVNENQNKSSKERRIFIDDALSHGWSEWSMHASNKEVEAKNTNQIFPVRTTIPSILWLNKMVF